MLTENIYDHIIESLIIFEKNAKSTYKIPIERRKEWAEMSETIESHFQDSKFFLYGINKFKNSHVKDKFHFIYLYNKVVAYGLIKKHNNLNRIPATVLGVRYFTSSQEIFGPGLIATNAMQIELSSTPDFDSTNTPTYSIRPSEYKSIIEDWYVMWLEQEQHWGNLFDEKYFAHEVIEPYGEIKFLNPIEEEAAYKKFWIKREALIDSWIASGRLQTKSPGIYSR